MGTTFFVVSQEEPDFRYAYSLYINNDIQQALLTHQIHHLLTMT